MVANCSCRRQIEFWAVHLVKGVVHLIYYDNMLSWENAQSMYLTLFSTVKAYVQLISCTLFHCHLNTKMLLERNFFKVLHFKDDFYILCNETSTHKGLPCMLNQWLQLLITELPKLCYQICTSDIKNYPLNLAIKLIFPFHFKLK